MFTDKKKYMVVAHDANLGIGINNKLPWYFKSDIKYFKKLTTEKGPIAKSQNVLIMGRHTWDSIPVTYRPFSERINVVISRTMPGTGPFDVNKVNVFSSLDDAFDEIDKANLDSKVFIIGGSQIYDSALEYNDIDIIATTIKGEYECDAYFPEYRDKYKLHGILNIHDDNLDIRLWRRIVS